MQDKCKKVDSKQIANLLQNIPDSDAIIRMAAVFQALQSDTRLKILFLLRQEEMCVCELEQALACACQKGRKIYDLLYCG